MTTVQRPENGARFVFERGATSSSKIDYSAIVFLSDRELTFSLSVDPASHAITMAEPADPGPEWIAAVVLAFAKTIVSQNKDEAPEQWPRRLVRWRQK